MIQKQFSKFIVIGVFSTIINYSLFYLLFSQLALHYLFSSALGFIAGVFAGYSFNKVWTFNIQEDSNTHFIKYCATYTSSLVLGLITLNILVAILGLPPAFANILVIGLTTCTNFIGTKFWVFKA